MHCIFNLLMPGEGEGASHSCTAKASRGVQPVKPTKEMPLDSLVVVGRENSVSGPHRFETI